LVRLAALEQGKQLASYWRQRRKFHTCKLGDENTKFHHLTATVQWRRNQIRTLQAADNTLVTDHASKAAILHTFYSELLGQADECTAMPDLASILSYTALTTNQVAQLIGPFTLEELKTILFPMKTDTAPGPDGFTPLFFRAAWDLVKDDLLAFLNYFHAGTADLQRVNKAFLALLPKKATSLLPKDYRPSPYKTVSLKSALKA